MSPDDSTPPSEESVSDAQFDYQSIGQTLLRGELEREATALRDAFLQLSMKVERDEDLDQSDVDELRTELNQARELVELIEEGLNDG